MKLRKLKKQNDRWIEKIYYMQEQMTYIISQ